MKIDFRCIVNLNSIKVIECRFYSDGSYEEESPYDGSCVIYVVEDKAEVRLLTKKENSTLIWDLKIDQKIGDYLREKGVKEVRYRHKGQDINRDLEIAAHRYPVKVVRDA